MTNGWNRLLRIAALLVPLCVAGGLHAKAADYPVRTVKIVVPFAAGGGTDVIARIFSAHLAKVLKQTVIVEDRPGGQGLVGSNLVAKSNPDGYTLLFTPQSTITIAPHFERKLPYNPAKDLAPIALVAQQPMIFVANAKLPVHNLTDFIKLAKQKPGKLYYGSPGLSTELNLTVEILKQKAGINIVHVAYRGGAPAINALLRGEIQMLPVVPSAIGPFIKSGKVTPLATTAPARIPEFPQIRTTKELGYPSVNVVPWWGVFAPAATPKKVLQQLQAAIVQLRHDTQYRNKLAKMSTEAMAITGEKFGKMLAMQTARWGRVIKAAGLHLN